MQAHPIQALPENQTLAMSSTTPLLNTTAPVLRVNATTAVYLVLNIVVHGDVYVLVPLP